VTQNLLRDKLKEKIYVVLKQMLSASFTVLAQQGTQYQTLVAIDQQTETGNRLNDSFSTKPIVSRNQFLLGCIGWEN